MVEEPRVVASRYRSLSRRRLPASGPRLRRNDSPRMEERASLRACLRGVSSWVGTRLAYVSGSSRPTDGAVRTLLARQGVCRDFAHACVALLRGLGIPARLVSVYAPGLEPMDFHAVAEAWVDGARRAFDALPCDDVTELVSIG